MLPPQLNFFTLACRDVEPMADFFRALGWPESTASEPAHRVFQLPNGVVLRPVEREHDAVRQLEDPVRRLAGR